MAKPPPMQPNQWCFGRLKNASLECGPPGGSRARDFFALGLVGAELASFPSSDLGGLLCFPNKGADAESLAGRGQECESDIRGAVHRLPRCKHVWETREWCHIPPTRQSVATFAGKTKAPGRREYLRSVRWLTRMFLPPARRCAGQLQVCCRGADP